MKILHILDHSLPVQSGYTFRTRNILMEQKARGWETIHVTGLKQKNVISEKEQVNGLDFHRTIASTTMFRKIPILNQWQVVSSLSKRICELIESEKPDILHAHSPALNGIAGLLARKKYGLPLVYECRAFWEDAAVDHGTSKEHGVRYRLTHALETWVFKNANAVTTICEGLRNDIVTRGIAESKITVIPNAVDVNQFCFQAPANNELLNKLGFKNKVVLGFIGSFYAYEGIPLLLDALERIRSIKSEVKLLLVGGGPQEQLISRLLIDKKLQDTVVMTGRISHEEIQDYYNVVDIFIYPRLPMRLTELVTPLKPLEAMAQGKLVIASDVGGHKELINDNVTGRLFQANNVDSLVKTVLDVVDKKNHWNEICENAREYVVNERSWTKSVSHYQNVYDQVLNHD